MKPNEQLVRICFEQRREWARQLLASVTVSPAALVELHDMIQTTYENQPERRLEGARKSAVEIQRLFFGEPEIDAEKPDPTPSEPNPHIGVSPDAILPGNTGFGGEILIGPRMSAAVPVRVFPKARDCVAGVAVATCDGPLPTTPEDGAREVFEVIRRWIQKERKWSEDVAPTPENPRSEEMRRMRITLESLEQFVWQEERRLGSHGFAGLRAWKHDRKGGWHRTLGG